MSHVAGVCTICGRGGAVRISAARILPPAPASATPVPIGRTITNRSPAAAIDPTRRVQPLGINIGQWVSADVAVQTPPAAKPNRIRLHIPPKRGVVMAVPVVGEAALELEPLAGEAHVLRRRVRPDVGHPAERRVDHVPHPARILRRHSRRTHQVVDMHEIDDRIARGDIVGHRHRHVVQPDVFALRLPGGVELGDDVVGEIVHIDRRRRGRRGRMGHRARRQSSPRVIGVGSAFRRIVGLSDLRQPALDIVLQRQPERARATWRS